MYKQLGKSIMDEQPRRRSPRITALESSSSLNHRKSVANQGHLYRENACRIKRKIDDNGSLVGTSRLAKQVWRGRDYPVNADQWISSYENRNKRDFAFTNGKDSVMPDKHILELVLDTLQRRDTYEMFGEPVDTDEVEDYHTVIEEPMDFGTMRAKLHEGMYKNLQQFERDVFLIPENAMRFNASGSLYFRQARALHELAKKVMNALKMDPRSFEQEFSGTRRRSMRKALRDNKPPRCAATDVSSQRSTKKVADSFCMRSAYIRNGSRESRLSNCDRRCRQWSPFLFSEPDPAICNTPKPNPRLVLNDEGLSYQESLMLYVKDLGPVAHMVAKRKLLLRQHETNVDDIDQHGEEATAKERTDCRTAPAKQTGSINIEEKCIGLTGNPYSDSSSQKGTSHKDEILRPVVLALENCPSRVAEFRSRNKRTCSAVPVSSRDAVCAAGNLAQPQPQPHFIFDLPFLKSRLDQMTNAMKVNGQVLKKPVLQDKGGGETFVSSSICEGSFLHRFSNTSKDQMEANLVLQL